MITLHLTRANDYEGVYLSLPATPEKINEVLAYLDNISADTVSTRIVGAVSKVWGIGQYLKSADINDLEHVKKLNRIAEIVGDLNRDESRIFEGALNSESVNSLDDVIAIGEHLHQYLMLSDVSTDHELGAYLVETGVIPFDESVRPYLDYTKIGIEYYANHGGAYTIGGYVLRRDSAEQALLDIVEARKDSPILCGMEMK